MKKKRACPQRQQAGLRGGRVVCAMSGGVDSSVAAALLQKQGYEVIGVFMKLWAEDVPRTDLVRENICCSVEAATAARAVARKLNIPFYVLNVEKEFKKAVVDYYIKEYDNGRTPNPCVICNRDIKGEVLLKKALELEADFLATGHYVRIVKKKEYQLLQAVDKTKDQTYFLWTLTQEKLGKILFPVGDYLKSDIRKMAKEWELPTATRRESQGICFIPDRDVSGFLRRHAKKLVEPGEIYDTKGKKLGVHDGLINYTIGQRERLGLGGPRAYYVVELNSHKNTLIVGDAEDLYKKELVASDLNWLDIDFESQLEKLIIGARIRYGHPIDRCKVTLIGKKAKVVFEKPQRAITPGQSVVFYNKEQVLGGGVIEK
ncbi:MAG: tRNA 2-thiouridine(34) synthase MnmA [Patescibacteria group bacterium]